jgi:hypothetical protein
MALKAVELRTKTTLYHIIWRIYAMVSLAEGFGFNTNLLETNILNLAVVLPLVFSLGKDTFTKTLDLRLENSWQSPERG